MELPPLNLSASSSASGRLDSGGSGYGLGAGDWNVNLGGSGFSSQGAGSAQMPPMIWLVLAAGAVWLLTKK